MDKCLWHFFSSQAQSYKFLYWFFPPKTKRNARAVVSPQPVQSQPLPVQSSLPLHMIHGAPASSAEALTTRVRWQLPFKISGGKLQFCKGNIFHSRGLNWIFQASEQSLFNSNQVHSDPFPLLWWVAVTAYSSVELYIQIMTLGIW